jgi:hypothetical protein
MRNLFLATFAVVFVAAASIAMLMTSSDSEMKPLTLAGVQEAVYGT